MPLPIFINKFLSFGRSSEILAADHLRSLGYRVIGSGFRTRHGEVDLIAWDGDVLVFIEVKARRSSEPPEDAVNFRKRQRILRAAGVYIARHRLEETPYRFDIVAVTNRSGRASEFRVLRNAFQA